MMDSRRILFLAAAAGLFPLALPSAHAQTIMTYSGSDSGAGPANPDPNTTAARATFTAAAAGFGPSTLLTFETSMLSSTTPLGSTTFKTNGVQVTGTNNVGGISKGGDAIVGYNTTTKGSQFLQLDSSNALKPVTEVFNFTNGSPITAFGADFTGVGTETGTTTITFSDGSQETETLPGSSKGGIEFFGFTDTKGLAIQSVTVGVFPVGKNGTTDDVIGVDDVLLYNKVPPASAAPEPSQMATLLLGITLFGGLILMARKRRTAPLV